MAWGKLDDGYHSHPKIRAALAASPEAVALHGLAISYCAHYETDGHVPDFFIQGVYAEESQRQRALDALVEGGLWRRNGAGYELHDYLDYNMSREDLEAKRERDRKRKAGERASKK